MKYSDVIDCIDGVLYTKVKTGPNSTIGEKKFKERKDGYLDIKLFGKKHLYHRVVWELVYGEIPDGMFIDHIDHNRKNNKPSNLRLVTRTENNRNSSLRHDNKSGFSGVRFCKQKNKWQATIGDSSKLIQLGFFDSFDLAVKCRSRALDNLGYHKNHGE